MTKSRQKTAVIIGAGPAGLTAAYQLLTRTNITPIVLEQSAHLGGLAKTINHHGYRLDIGGHRFFTKSRQVNDWWFQFLPPETTKHKLSYQGQTSTLRNSKLKPTGPKMLVRSRLSRILYDGHLYDYPLQITPRTLANLGPTRLLSIAATYTQAKLFPKPEKNLEDFFINRFGSELYHTFFKTYTQKVWGVPCNHLSADWGRQRIKGMSVSRAVKFALIRSLPKAFKPQTQTETSLIEHFLYPPLGPGQLWETVAKKVVHLGGTIHHHHQVNSLHHFRRRISQVTATNANGKTFSFPCDYCFSTMPIKFLIKGLHQPAPQDVLKIATTLPYRDFIVVGLLVTTKSPLPPDNWIYFHDKNIAAGRLQIFNNWSPGLVRKGNKYWLGLEYFVNHTDPFWLQTDHQITQAATSDLKHTKLFSDFKLHDSLVVREKKAYPSYSGSYQYFDKIRSYLDSFTNLYPLGRNGMHRYNNQDHSILTALTAVDNIVKRTKDKSNLWSINTELDHHETSYS